MAIPKKVLAFTQLSTPTAIHLRLYQVCFEKSRKIGSGKIFNEFNTLVFSGIFIGKFFQGSWDQIGEIWVGNIILYKYM
jgi:hypothetical protein